jgi:hypothetical protein
MIVIFRRVRAQAETTFAGQTIEMRPSILEKYPLSKGKEDKLPKVTSFATNSPR